MGEPTENGVTDDGTWWRVWRSGAGTWDLEVERLMRPRTVIVAGKLADESQVALVHDDDVVETLATECADESLGDPVGLRRGDRREHRADADACRARDEVTAVRAIAISDQEPGPGAPRRGVDELAPDPGCRRMSGDVDVRKRPTVVRDQEEDVERLEEEACAP